jgi:hypothetical protein
LKNRIAFFAFAFFFFFFFSLDEKKKKKKKKKTWNASWRAQERTGETHVFPMQDKKRSYEEEEEDDDNGAQDDGAVDAGAEDDEDGANFCDFSNVFVLFLFVFVVLRRVAAARICSFVFARDGFFFFFFFFSFV